MPPGLLIGINPVIGTTTLLCLAVAFRFRLNVVASQIANHAMFPLELALVVPFIRLGSRVFHTAAMPLAPRLFLQAARTRAAGADAALWMWEWHAFVLWAAIAVVAAPLMALALTPLLERVHERGAAAPVPDRADAAATTIRGFSFPDRRGRDRRI